MVSVIWQMVHNDQLFVVDLESLSSAIPNRNHAITICRHVLLRVKRIVDVSSVLTPSQQVPCSEDNQYLLM